MKKAMQMEEGQYQELSIISQRRFEQYVRPLDEYAMEYLKLIQPRMKNSERIPVIDFLRGLSCLGVLALPCTGRSVDWLVANYQLSTGIFLLCQSYGLAFHPHPIYGICGCPLFSD
jgi:hypothetical protein